MPDDWRLVGLERLIDQRGEQLLRTAILLTGNHDAGEDLLQDALERLLRHWRHVAGNPEPYLRRVLYNLAVDRWRRQAVREKSLRLVLQGDSWALDDGMAAVDLQDTLVRLLGQLPPRQRAIIVMRYWEDLSETDVAAVLGCSVGAVKSGTSRGIARLRELCAPALRHIHTSGPGQLPGNAASPIDEPSVPNAFSGGS